MNTLIPLLTIVFTLGSFLFCFFAITRLYSYIQRYRFDESHYTLLLGFVRLKWMVYLYGLMILILGITSLLGLVPLFFEAA